jgi:hypothetical protein
MSINLSLEISEVEAVVAGLRKLPMELIEETVNKIKIQAIPQIQSQQAAAQETAEPQPEVPVKQTNLTE